MPATQPAAPPPRPALQDVTPFMLLEREVELEYRSRREESLQNEVGAVADSLRGQTPLCSRCSQPMKRHDTEPVLWTARFGRFHAPVDRYSVPGLQRRAPALAGSSGRGTGAHQRFAGAPAGCAGRSGAL
jgi:hypothetical protein